MRKIKALVVDDSAVIRQVVSGILARDRGIEVSAAVADPLFAMQRMKMEWPDVIVLDVEMPRMDGITFLRKLMAERPTPVVICSTLTKRGAETTMQALAAGAISIVTKPTLGARDHLLEMARDLIDTVKGAAQANLKNIEPQPSPVQPLPESAMAETTERIVAMGTSTGGTQALEKVLSSLPRVSHGMVIVQHMPEKFTAAFAARLDSICEISVREGRHGDRVIPGLALIAPGGKHMQLRRSGAQYHVEIGEGPPVNRHRPSVDVLFRSVAKAAGANALGVIMTGMGDDGARGLLEMREAGARTVAQDEASSVVWGMPAEAIKRGAAGKVVPLHSISREICARAA
jgi:two-component system chemotaxis response regulator CheB